MASDKSMKAPDPGPITALLEVMAALRHPETGCPWDLQQDFASIAPYTIEEAYEVADAIVRDDLEHLKDELGDLLLQVVFHARMAEEAGLFAFADVAEAIRAKMVRRHPHVFGKDAADTPEAVTANWETIKAEEKAARGDTDGGLLDDVPVALPALPRAEKIGKRLARIGFDWPDTRGVFAKLREEIDELETALYAGDRLAQEEEFGDVLFTLANLARHIKIDAEGAGRKANEKVARRVRHMENVVRERGSALTDLELEALEALWTEAKASERRWSRLSQGRGL